MGSWDKTPKQSESNTHVPVLSGSQINWLITEMEQRL